MVSEQDEPHYNKELKKQKLESGLNIVIALADKSLNTIIQTFH